MKKTAGILLFLVVLAVLFLTIGSSGVSAEENYGYRYKIILPAEEDGTQLVFFANDWTLKHNIVRKIVWDEEKKEYRPKSEGNHDPMLSIPSACVLITPSGERINFKSGDFYFRYPWPEPWSRRLLIYDFERKRIIQIPNYSPSHYSCGSTEFEEEKK